MNEKWVTILISAVFVLFLGGNCLAAEKKPLRVYGMAPKFTLTKAGGASFSSDALAGKIWVGQFFFTSCEGPCPMIMGRIANLATKYRKQEDVHFVSFTVDPARDTPEVLHEYAKKLGADQSRWHFLTGKQEDILGLKTAGFQVGSEKAPELHTTQFALVDAKGQVRGIYYGTREKQVKQAESDIKRLLDEK